MNMPFPPGVFQLEPEVVEFLRDSRTSEFAPNFVAERVLYEDLKEIAEDDEIMSLLIPLIVPRRRFIRRARQLGTETPAASAAAQLTGPPDPPQAPPVAAGGFLSADAGRKYSPDAEFPDHLFDADEFVSVTDFVAFVYQHFGVTSENDPSLFLRIERIVKAGNHRELDYREHLHRIHLVVGEVGPAVVGLESANESFPLGLEKRLFLSLITSYLFVTGEALHMASLLDVYRDYFVRMGTPVSKRRHLRSVQHLNPHGHIKWLLDVAAEKCCYATFICLYKCLRFRMPSDPENLFPPDYELAPTQHFRVKSLTGRVYRVPCCPLSTVVTIKLRIQEISGIPLDQQRLIHGGRQLSFHGFRTLESYGADAENDFMHLVLRLRGGKPVILLYPPRSISVDAVEMHLDPRHWSISTYYPKTQAEISEDCSVVAWRNMKVTPSGRISFAHDDSSTFSYLFWESSTKDPNPSAFDFEVNGEPIYVVDRSVISEFLYVLLTETKHLREKDAHDMVTFWLGQLEEEPRVAVQMMSESKYECLARLNIDCSFPRSKLRFSKVFLVFVGLSANRRIVNDSGSAEVIEVREDGRSHFGAIVGQETDEEKRLWKTSAEDGHFVVFEWGGMNIYSSDLVQG